MTISPDALNSSPAISIFTIVSWPSASREQHAKNRRAINSYSNASWPFRSLPHLTGWIGGCALSSLPPGLGHWKSPLRRFCAYKLHR